jgi:hypothetical protein
MRFWTVIGVIGGVGVLGLAGCSGSKIQCQGCEDTSETDNPDADTDTDADSDSDTDTDTDTDSDTDTDTNPSACHPWDPADTFGWTREYDIQYEDRGPGTETQTGNGVDVDQNGNAVFSVGSTADIGDGSWDAFEFHDCDHSGAALLVGGTATFHDPQSGDVPVTFTDDPAREYLPSQGDMGNAGSWNYSYTLASTVQGTPVNVPTTGTYVEMGFESSYSTSAGTFHHVYHLTNSWTQDRSGVPQNPGPATINGYSEYYYAEGIGLIYEDTVDADSGDNLMHKELTGYTGLTPQ